MPASADGMRLNRYLARAGIASRRNCDHGVQSGMVTVNGSLVTDPSNKLSAGDIVLWDGTAVTLPEMFIAIMNKPSGYETTMEEKKSSRPVTLLSGGMPRGCTPVGRLDVRTGGLLLWTNHGELVYRLTHPKWRIEREYRIITPVPVTPDMLKRLTKGGYIQPGVYSKPAVVARAGQKAISVVLKTGRNREVRKLSKACGVPMAGLERTRYGNIRLEESLERGSWRELTPEETRGLLKLVRLDISGS